MAERANVIDSLQVESGNRARSDAVVPLIPKPSDRFTGRTAIIARLKEHFLSDINPKGFQNREFFLLFGTGGIGKTQISLKFIEEMSD